MPGAPIAATARRVAPSRWWAYSPPATWLRWVRRCGQGVPGPRPPSGDLLASSWEPTPPKAEERDAPPRAPRACKPAPGTCKSSSCLRANGHGAPKPSPRSSATARLDVGARRGERRRNAVEQDAPPRARRTFWCSLGSPGTCTTCLRWARRCVREVAGTLRPSRAFAVVAPPPTPPKPEERDATPRPWCTCKPCQRGGRGRCG